MSDELDDLKKEVAKLKDQLNPPPRPPSTHAPRDYTAGMSMPANALAAMVAAVPDVQTAAIVHEMRHGPAQSSSMTKPAAATEPPKTIGTKGWVDARPLTPPEGIGLVDQIAEGFAKRERRGG